MLHLLTSIGSTRRLAAFSTLVIWSAAAAVTAYWALQFAGLHGPASQAPSTASAMPAQPALAAVQKALGAASGAALEAKPETGSRFVILGVAALHSGQGAALIAVDGQAPKAFKVGQVVAEGWLLQSLGPRQARLAATLDSPAVITLDMPALAASASGVSPPP